MASAQKKDDQSSGDVLVAAVAGTFSVLAAVCLTAAIFFACYKSQKRELFVVSCCVCVKEAGGRQTVFIRKTPYHL